MVRAAILLHLLGWTASAADPLTKTDSLGDPLPTGAMIRFGTSRFQDSSIGWAFAFSPDGQHCATGSANSPVCVWDCSNGKLIRTHASAASVYHLAWNPDGKLVALTFWGHSGFFMQEWAEAGDKGLDSETYQKLRQSDQPLENGRYSNQIILASGRRVMAFFDEYPRKQQRIDVFAWKPNTPVSMSKPMFSIEAPPGRRFGYGQWASSDGTTLLVEIRKNTDNVIRLLAYDISADKAPEKPSWEVDVGNSQRQPYYCLSRDGKQVVVGFGSEVEVWDGPAAKKLWTFKAPSFAFTGGGEQTGRCLSGDGKRLTIMSRESDGQLGGRIYDLESGREVTRLRPRPFPAHFRVAFSPDGRRLACSGSGVARVWDAQTGDDAVPLPGHCGPIHAVATSEDGKIIMSAGADLTVRGWDAASGRELWCNNFPDYVTLRSVSKNHVIVEGRLFANYSGGLDKPLIDISTGKLMPLPGAMAEQKRGPKDQFGREPLTRDNLLAISPDGSTAVTFEPQQPALRVWSWPKGEMQRTFLIDRPEKLVNHGTADKPWIINDLRLAIPRVVFTPDSKALIALSFFHEQFMGSHHGHEHYPFLDRWNLASGERIERNDIGYGKSPVLLSNSSRSLLLHWDNIQDAESGKMISKIEDQENRLLGYNRGQPALSPDGKTIAFPGSRRREEVLLLEVATGKMRTSFPKSKSQNALAFFPDGRLVTVGETAIVWKAVTE